MRKITEEEFLKRFKKYTENYIPIGPYVDYNEKYKVKHSCGYEYYIIPKYFFRGKYKCPICNITHKITDEIFKLKLLRTFPKFDQYFEILSPYNGYDDPITVRHKLCSSVYETTPRDLIRTENTCNTCNPRRFVKIPPDEIKERFNLAFENKKEEYQVLNYDEIVEYDSIIKLKHVHDNCNYEFETDLFSLETGYGCSCPVCYRVKVITPELFVLKFKRTNLYKSGEYELVDYKDGIPVLKHITCGNIFESSHNGVLYFECGCPKCNVGNRFKPYSHEKFISELEEGFLENYDVMSEYTRYDEIITIKHKKCGSIIDTTPAKIISRGNCVCSNCYNLKQISSRGEAKVKAFLVDNSISFNFQHCFKECRDKYPLPFDFYIPELNVAIEYDGEQHFEFIEYFHENEQGFEDQIRRDNIKTQYCKKNNINLVRIPYWQYPDIDNILNKVIFEE